MSVFPILVNGKSYEWADVVLNIFGIPFAGVKAIEYDDAQDMVNVMGAGNRPVSRAYGNYTPTAKVTLLMEEMEAIQAVAPGRVLQRIPEFDISVSFYDTEGAAVVPTTHTLKNCRFKNNGRKMQQGDTEIGCEMDLIISHVNF